LYVYQLVALSPAGTYKLLGFLMLHQPCAVLILMIYGVDGPPGGTPPEGYDAAGS